MLISKLKKINPYAIAVVLFSFVFLRTVIPAGIIDLLFLIMLCFFVPKMEFSKDNLALALMIMIFLISILVSSLVSSDRVSLLDLMRVFVFGFVAILIVGLSREISKDRKFFSLVMRFFLVICAAYSGVVVLAFVLFYMRLNVPILYDMLYVRGSVARVAGLFDNPNYFSFSMFFAFVVAFFCYKTKGISKYTLGLILLGGLVSLSRGFILGVVIFLFVYASLSFFSLRNISLKKTFAVLLLPVFFVPLLVCLFSSQYELAASEIANTIKLRFSDGGGGAGARLESILNWYHYGASSYWQLLWGNGSGFFQDYSSSNSHAHNTYIRILGEFGLPSLMAFIFCLLVAARLTLNKISVFNCSAVLSLVGLFFTNDYYLVRETWLVMAFLYIAPSLNQWQAVSGKSGVEMNG